MNILDAIIEHKRIEILKRKRDRPLSDLSGFPHYARETNTVSLENGGNRPGIIAEFKRRSPSRGDIHPGANPVQVATGYSDAGAAAISILTDRNFFGGSFQDLSAVREALPGMPLLRKDFIIDPYQVHEASAYGADLILLIAAILDKSQVSDLAREARSLGLHVLFEVHTEEDLEKYDPGIRYVGVNNRDLKTFRVDTATSLQLITRMPEGVIPVSESGLGDREEMLELAKSGYRLFLMGEAFMKTEDPGRACREYLNTF